MTLVPIFPMYEVEYSPLAEREIRKLPVHISTQIRQAVDHLVEDPRPRNCRKLKVSGEYRIRLGKYRVSYKIDDGPRKF